MLVKSSARLRFISIPPRKMRFVADSIKGLPVEKALGILNFTPRIAAHHLAKTLKSAAANALSVEGTEHLKPEDLMVKDVFVDAAPTAKRIRYRSMGRVYRYRKRYCHLTIELEGEMESAPDKKKSKRKTAKKESVEAESVEVNDKKDNKKIAVKEKSAETKNINDTKNDTDEKKED